MDGFKNTTKTSYDTTSGRKFANGGMTVSRADMPGGEGPMNKPALVAKYAKGGHVNKGEQKIGRVMEEFTKGKLHSGSKEGPKVKSTKQAVAIALNEARAAGAKIPRVKKARGGMMEEGGTYNERGKRATLAEIAAEGRRVEGRKPPVEGISTRPTDSSGRRMTDKELGMVTTAKKTMKKAIGGGVDAKLSRSITNAKAQQDRMAAAPSFDPSKPSSGSGSMSKLLGLAGKTVAPPARGPSMGGMNRGDIVASKPTPVRGPSMGGMNRGDIVASKPTPVRGPSMAPAHSNRPMIRRAMGGLSSMPKGGKC